MSSREEHLLSRIDRAERLSRKLYQAPTVPIYDLQAVPPSVSFQYVLTGSGATSTPLDSDTWYSIAINYDWTDFSDASVRWSVDTFDSGFQDWSGHANPGKCTGFSSSISGETQPGIMVVRNGSGPGTSQDESAFYSQGLLSSGLGGEILGGGFFAGDTVFANTGITDADASNSCSVSIDVMVPGSNGSEGPVDGYRVIDLGCGDGGGLDTGVFLDIGPA